MLITSKNYYIMGGVKNREAKMKANHVAASGAGGGTKGVSIIDKRGQEVKCPHCDKTYVNVRISSVPFIIQCWLILQHSKSGRLKEHIASKHSDQEPQAGPSTSSQATPASGGASGGGNTVKAPIQPIRAPPSASAKTSSVSSAAPPGPQQSSQAPPPASGGGMMDVGSKAGYYTSKSPKLQLLELCQKDKKPTPRYSARTAEGSGEEGGWSCKVVLPDPKKRENDQVIFLPRDLAAPDAWEAEQRVAVVALHWLAGDRQLEMVLPTQYRGVWRQVKEEATKRKEASLARQEKEVKRRERVKERTARLNSRGPKLVVMSEAKQELIRALLQERYSLIISRLMKVEVEQSPYQAQIEDKLCHQEGFLKDQVAKAIHSCQCIYPQGLTLEDVRDWLFIQVLHSL